MRDALGGVQSASVLGGRSDIAVATLRKLVADRCRTVVLAGRDLQALEPVATELREAGATTVDTVEFDALEPASHERIVNDVFDRHDDLDLVLVAFGVLGDQDRFDDSPTEAAELVTANYVGAVSSGLAVAKRLKRQGHGVLAVISSVAGERSRKDNYVYGSSKAGLDAFAQGLGDALVGSGARVMVIRPGFVHSKMTEGQDPAPFSTTPEAVADSIVDGLRRDRETVYAPPVLRLVFSVMRHLPRPLWRKVSASR
jgi:decaprenylphospho-beta-D-erythro-pentofuranosid-2-ulose 2-reductase